MSNHKKWGKIPSDPTRLFQVPDTGSKVTRADLLTTGEMLEAERELGTRKAAKLFQPSSGEYTWGVTGRGDVRLPLYNGRYVDIDWLNTLVSFGVIDYAGYAAGKLGWSVCDAILKRSWGVLKGHLNAYFSAEEQNAVEMARAIIVGGARLRDILHPELVRMAEDCLQQHRREKSRPNQQSVAPSPQPIEFILAPKPSTQSRRATRQVAQAGLPAGSLRSIAQGLQPQRSIAPPPGSLRRMAQGLQPKPTSFPPPGSLRWMAQGLQTKPSVFPTPGSLKWMAQGLQPKPSIAATQPSQKLMTQLSQPKFPIVSAPGSLRWMAEGLQSKPKFSSTPGPLRWMAQGLQPQRTIAPAVGSLRWMAQGLQVSRPTSPAPGSLGWMAQGLR